MKLTRKDLVLCLCLSGGQADAAPLTIGIATAPARLDTVAHEWRWALRGGGAELTTLTSADLAHPQARLALLIVDSFPLDAAARQGLKRWVGEGGTLLYANIRSLLEESMEPQGAKQWRISEPDLFGVRFAGFNASLSGTYPDVVESSPILSPLIAGDALRLGHTGIVSPVEVEETSAKVLARSARLTPGPGAWVEKISAPTMLTNHYGKGRVLLLSFSPGQIAACNPGHADGQPDRLDCSAAGTAHALMRWLTANLLWEFHRLQIPLRWEVPGGQPHAFVVTGDVHGAGDSLERAFQVGKILEDLRVPFSFYTTGVATEGQSKSLAALHSLKNFELATHSYISRGYTGQKYKWGHGPGMLIDLRHTEAALGIPHFPKPRDWLASMRNHSWASDLEGWGAMHQGGIGLVFDSNADTLEQRYLYAVPAGLYEEEVRRRLFVPLFEHNIATSTDNFRLPLRLEKDMAGIASPQPDPSNRSASWPQFGRYVLNWHSLFARLATMGGLTEVWLWHPSGVLTRPSGVAEVTRIVNSVLTEPAVSAFRADVLANWRANRERFPIKTERDDKGAITAMDLLSPTDPPYPLPPDAPSSAATTSYWVIGPLAANGWSTRTWTDPVGRPITVLVHPLSNALR